MAQGFPRVTPPATAAPIALQPAAAPHIAGCLIRGESQSKPGTKMVFGSKMGTQNGTLVNGNKD